MPCYYCGKEAPKGTTWRISIEGWPICDLCYDLSSDTKNNDKETKTDTQIALEIKRQRHRSFKNIRDAARHLQGKPHDPFGTNKVKSSSLSCVRLIQQEADMTASQVERWAAKEVKD